MSAEVLMVVIATASLAVTFIGALFAGLAWVVRRMDERLDKSYDRVDERFDKVDQRPDGLQSELTEVKIAVARLEGPRPRLALPH